MRWIMSREAQSLGATENLFPLCRMIGVIPQPDAESPWHVEAASDSSAARRMLWSYRNNEKHCCHEIAAEKKVTDRDERKT